MGGATVKPSERLTDPARGGTRLLEGLVARANPSSGGRRRLRCTLFCTTAAKRIETDRAEPSILYARFYRYFHYMDGLWAGKPAEEDMVPSKRGRNRHWCGRVAVLAVLTLAVLGMTVLVGACSRTELTTTTTYRSAVRAEPAKNQDQRAFEREDCHRLAGIRDRARIEGAAQPALPLGRPPSRPDDRARLCPVPA